MTECLLTDEILNHDRIIVSCGMSRDDRPRERNQYEGEESSRELSTACTDVLLADFCHQHHKLHQSLLHPHWTCKHTGEDRLCPRTLNTHTKLGSNETVSGASWYASEPNEEEDGPRCDCILTLDIARLRVLGLHCESPPRNHLMIPPPLLTPYTPRRELCGTCLPSKR